MKVSRIADASFKEVQQAAMDVLHNLQRRPPQVQLAGMGWLFLLACQRYGLNESEALRVVDRMVRHVLSVAPQYPRALQEYMKHEWPS